MQLYLSSFRLGGCPARLVELLRGSRVVVMANAADEYPTAARTAAVEGELEALTNLGLEPFELDLRAHFGAGAVADELARCDGVWIRGGNVFLLRHALARSGADAAITAQLDRDAIVVGGYSAGPCVLAPSLRGLELTDDPRAVDRVYGSEPTWEGLAVLGFAIVPHVDSPDHPETELCRRVAAAYARDGTPHRTLRDGEVLVIDGAAESICR